MLHSICNGIELSLNQPSTKTKTQTTKNQRSKTLHQNKYRTGTECKIKITLSEPNNKQQIALYSPIFNRIDAPHTMEDDMQIQHDQAPSLRPAQSHLHPSHHPQHQHPGANGADTTEVNPAVTGATSKGFNVAVEVCLLPQSTADFGSVEARVSQFLREEFDAFTTGQICFTGEDFLERNVHSIRICGATDQLSNPEETDPVHRPWNALLNPGKS